MSTKTKWMEHHNHEADHAAAKAAHHQERKKGHLAHAALHDELHKSTGMKVHKTFADQHRADASIHDRMSTHYSTVEAYHRDQAEKCSKALESDFEKRSNELVSTSVSGVTPGVRAVPRPGQQHMRSSADKPNVPSEFHKLFTVEDEQEQLR